MTYGDLLTGGGGATLGAISAGLQPLWGIEVDPRIAATAERNLGHPITIADVTTIDPAGLPRVDVLHASPVCTTASSANWDGTESRDDYTMADAIIRFLQHHQPRIFTLENVWLYRHYGSFHRIVTALNRKHLGYMFHIGHLDAADYGVPQTRHRLILRAIKGAMLPALPEPTPHRSWYEAIADLLPTMRSATLARFQARVQPDPAGPLYVGAGGRRGEIATRPADRPSLTITANPNQAAIRILMPDGTAKLLSLEARARLQGFPGGYDLPDDKQLAGQIVGNAVPPPMMAAILGQLVAAAQEVAAA